MNLLFWNLANHNIPQIKNLIEENSVDLSIFAEYKTTDLTSVVSNLHDVYRLHEGYGGCDKITILARKGASITIRRESTRYSIFSYDDGLSSYIIAGIHLPSNPRSGPEDRKNVIRDLVEHVSLIEKETNNCNTIIIGDFNASPFDDELIQKDAFNAVLYKGLIVQKEYVTCSNKRYRRFYNPMVDYISEASTNYGSFYYGSGINSLYWFCYDQILVRKPLINAITNIYYCKSINGKSLLNRSMPKKSISDHLPLIVQLERKI